MRRMDALPAVRLLVRGRLLTPGHSAMCANEGPLGSIAALSRRSATSPRNLTVRGNSNARFSETGPKRAPPQRRRRYESEARDGAAPPNPTFGRGGRLGQLFRSAPASHCESSRGDQQNQAPTNCRAHDLGARQAGVAGSDGGRSPGEFRRLRRRNGAAGSCIADQLRPGRCRLYRCRTAARRVADQLRPGRCRLCGRRTAARRVADQLQPGRCRLYRGRTAARRVADQLRPGRCRLYGCRTAARGVADQLRCLCDSAAGRVTDHFDRSAADAAARRTCCGRPRGGAYRRCHRRHGEDGGGLLSYSVRLDVLLRNQRLLELVGVEYERDLLTTCLPKQLLELILGPGNPQRVRLDVAVVAACDVENELW